MRKTYDKAFKVKVAKWIQTLFGLLQNEHTKLKVCSISFTARHQEVNKMLRLSVAFFIYIYRSSKPNKAICFVKGMK